MIGAFWRLAVAASLCLGLSTPQTMLAEGVVTGDLRKWHTVTISYAGPVANETDDSPNPFLDYRLRVTLTGPAGQTYVVPGFFDGDGQGGGRGAVWRIRFTPDQAGRWKYNASFRKGSDVAVSLSPTAGTATAFDGESGTFDIADRDTDAPGFLKWGRLEYSGSHYLRFRDGDYWIKGGTDSPENFLAYDGFDNTPKGKHTYREHIKDWRPGDPDWNDGAGKGIIGALNYLASQHVNLIYFLPMNIGGDGKDCWPFAGPVEPAGDPANDNVHYDISKLGQWEVVFAHAQRLGITLHFVFNEAERMNKAELGIDLTTRRKLFYREMVARFAHHNAILWNLCEEYNLQWAIPPENIRSFARYVRDIDPYDHPITVHHAKDPVASWKPFLGDELFSITSLQIGRGDIEPVVETFRRLSRQAGRPIPIAVDEFTVTTGDQPWLPEDDAEALRVEKLWPAYLSGGQVEFIVADLLETDNFRKHELLWRYTWYARKFLEDDLPFWEMEPADHLLEGESVFKGKTSTHDGQVFSKPGSCYALYLPTGRETGTLDLTAARGKFRQRWYNPRNGRFEGSAVIVSAPGRFQLGGPPGDISKDWALLLTQAHDQSNNATTILKVKPEEPAGRPGNGFEITYRWVAAPMEADYMVFVHFIDDNGRIVLQDDHKPPIPTSEWNGQVEYTRTVPLEQWEVRDKRTVSIGPAEGTYTILAGLYDEHNNRKSLRTGPGVTTAGENRYEIGVLRIDSEAPLPAPGKPTLDLTEYHVTFNEPFDQLSVSAWGPAGPGRTRWIAHTPWKGDFGNARFTDPKPDFPFTVTDGILRIEARKEDERWRSGLLSAVDPEGNGFKQKYGYFECRAKFPKGPGTWPAFWLVGLKNLKGLPDNIGPRINPEIDVVEHYGHWPWRFSYALHLWGFDGLKGTHDETRIVAFGVEEDFHTYGVLIDEQYIILYFDGVEMHRSQTPDAAKTPLYPLINLALGPGWPTDKTPNPSYMYVDYVRVWQKNRTD